MKNRFSNIFPNFFVRAKWEKNSIHVNEADLKIFKPFFMMCIKSMTSIKLHIHTCCSIYWREKKFCLDCLDVSRYALTFTIYSVKRQCWIYDSMRSDHACFIIHSIQLPIRFCNAFLYFMQRRREKSST